MSLDDDRPTLGDFFRMHPGGERLEQGRRIRVFWSDTGRRFELDARGRRWREVRGVGSTAPFDQGWEPVDGVLVQLAARAS